MPFSIKPAIRFGWETFKKRPWFFVGATAIVALAYAIVGSVTSGIDAGVAGSVDERTVVGGVVNWLLTTLVSMGVTAFYLKAHDDTDGVTLASLWHPRPFWKFFAASFLWGLAIVLGLILLIVPGVIVGLMFMFSTVIVIDRELGPIEALKESARITYGHKWTLFGFALLLMLLNIAGALVLVVGLLVSVPVSSLAFMQAYRTLAGKTAPRPADASLAA